MNKYNREPWIEIVNRIRPAHPRPLRPPRPLSLFGLIDMVEYIENNLNNKITMGTCVEIGSYLGESAEVFAKKFNIVYTVDPWLPRKLKGSTVSKGQCRKDIIKRYNEITESYSNIKHFESFSKDISKKFDASSIDMVYIDARHIYDCVKEDITLWLPKLKPNSFLCGHDFSDRFKGVKRAVIEIIGTPDITFDDTSWLIQYIDGERIK